MGKPEGKAAEDAALPCDNPFCPYSGGSAWGALIHGIGSDAEWRPHDSNPALVVKSATTGWTSRTLRSPYDIGARVLLPSPPPPTHTHAATITLVLRRHVVQRGVGSPRCCAHVVPALPPR